MAETTEPIEPIRIAIARWIGRSGYWRHVADPDRQWERCQIEADGLLDDLRENGYFRDSATLRSTSRDSEVREAAHDLYIGLVSEHGHDEKHSADWPACLPVHIAMNRYRRILDRSSEGPQADRPEAGPTLRCSDCTCCDTDRVFGVCGACSVNEPCETCLRDLPASEAAPTEGRP